MLLYETNHLWSTNNHENSKLIVYKAHFNMKSPNIVSNLILIMEPEVLNFNWTLV